MNILRRREEYATSATEVTTTPRYPPATNYRYTVVAYTAVVMLIPVVSMFILAQAIRPRNVREKLGSIRTEGRTLEEAEADLKAK